MRIYLEDNLLDAQIMPTDTEALDETLDVISFQFVNASPLPVKQMASVKMVDDEETDYWFVVTADSCEPFSLKQGKYRHSVTAIEKTRILAKYTMRNSVFSQPASKYKIGTNFLCAVAGQRTGSEGDIRYSYYQSQYGPYPYGLPEPLVLSSREKCGKAFVTIEVQAAIADAGHYPSEATIAKDIHSVADLNALITSPSHLDDVTSVELYYTLDETPYTETLSASDFAGGFYFNREMECPRIAYLLNLGATNLYIRPVQQLFFSGEMGYAGKNIPFFTVHFVVKAETYYHTAYDILNLIALRETRERTIDGVTYRKQAPFSLPLSGPLFELLKHTIAPDFSFTQCTVYEAVAEVFRLFDAIFTMDGDGVLGIRRFNEKGERKYPELTGINLSASEERYSDGLISHYQDARPIVDFPSPNAYAPTRTQSVGIPSQGDHCFSVSLPIHSIIECRMEDAFKIKIGGNSLWDYEIIIRGYELDITHYIIEESLWSGSLDTTDQLQTADPKILVQNNTVVFAQGDDKIKLAYSYSSSWGTTYYAFGNMINCALWRALSWRNVNDVDANKSYYPSGVTPQWNAVRMKIKYFGVFDGVAKVESVSPKFPGDMIVDQANGGVDLNRLGLNLLGLSHKLGQPTLNASQSFVSWQNRIEKGDWITYQGDIWVANVISYVPLGNGYYSGTISFVKDYNELSLRKNLLRQKRFTEISQNLVMKSEGILTEFAYYSTLEADVSNIWQRTCLDEAGFLDCLGATFGKYATLETVDYCYVKNGNNAFFVPSIKYGAGNMVSIEACYHSPMSAGIQTRVNYTGWFATASFVSSNVIYADEDGFMDEMDFGVAYNDSDEFNATFPNISEPQSKLLRIPSFKVYKQQNEIFALNYSLAFLPYDKNRDFIGSRFCENNFIVEGKRVSRKFRLYVSQTQSYSVSDTKGKGDYTAITSVQTSRSGTGAYTLVFSHASMQSGVSWAICDENGDIWFASNSSGYSQTEKRLYFQTRRERLL